MVYAYREDMALTKARRTALMCGVLLTILHIINR